MEYCNATGSSEQLAEQIASYKADPAWRRVYAFFRRDYWHVTNPVAWAAIQSAREILPSGHAKQPSWPDHITQKSYAFLHKCVALFDFVSPIEDQVISTWGHCWDILSHSDYQSNVLLRLDRQFLSKNIIDNDAGIFKPGDEKAFGCIPYCEAWSPVAIPIEAVKEVFRVPLPNDFGNFEYQRCEINEAIEAVLQPPRDPLWCLPEELRASLAQLGKCPEGVLEPDVIELLPEDEA